MYLGGEKLDVYRELFLNQSEKSKKKKKTLLDVCLYHKGTKITRNRAVRIRHLTMEDITEESLLDFIFTAGGKVKNSDLLNRYKEFINHNDKDFRGELPLKRHDKRCRLAYTVFWSIAVPCVCFT